MARGLPNQIPASGVFPREGKKKANSKLRAKEARPPTSFSLHLHSTDSKGWIFSSDSSTNTILGCARSRFLHGDMMNHIQP
jgi:hypothetical protein